MHSHRTIGCETRQLDYLFPKGGPPQITGAPVGHFIGMLNAFLVPLLRERPVNLIDVWDPGEVLRLMDEEGLGVSGGATYFLTSLLDHPDFTPEHLALMPFAGLGGSAVPVAVTERATRLGIKVFRSYGSTEHPSITGCLLDDPEEKRLTTDGRPLPGVELRLDDDGEIISRGPDCCLGLHRPRPDRRRLRRRGVVPDRRRRRARRRGLPHHHRPHLGHHHPGRREHQRPGDRGAGGRPGRRGRGGRGGRARRPPRGARRRRGQRPPGLRPYPRWTRCATTWPVPDWPARSGPSRSTRSTSSRGRRRARSRSSGSDSSSATGEPGAARK